MVQHGVAIDRAQISKSEAGSLAEIALLMMSGIGGMGIGHGDGILWESVHEAASHSASEIER